MIVKCANIFVIFVWDCYDLQAFVCKTLLQTISCNGYVVWIFMVIEAALFSQILLLESSEHNPQVLCLFSQGSVQRGETPSLNNFLGRTSDRSVSPVRSQCSGIFMNQSIFRYLSREIGQFQSTWAHFGKNKTMRPHMNMPTSRSLRFLWGSEFKIIQTKNS